MADKVFPKGVMAFAPHGSAPDFVKGAIVISLNELVKFCKENQHLLTDYKGEKQLKLQLLDGKKGLYLQVDTYKKDKQQEESLPF